MQIDQTHLKRDIRSVEEQLRAQKRLVRTTPTPWATNLARPLLALKARATLLYAVAAHRRGRELVASEDAVATTIRAPTDAKDS